MNHPTVLLAIQLVLVNLVNRKFRLVSTEKPDAVSNACNVWFVGNLIFCKNLENAAFNMLFSFGF